VSQHHTAGIIAKHVAITMTRVTAAAAADGKTCRFEQCTSIN